MMSINLAFNSVLPTIISSFRFGEFASDILSQQIEPLVEKVFQNSNMPDAKFKFTKTDMGNVPPKLDNISCHKDESMIILDFDLVYDGNCDLQVGLLGMNCGVQNLKIWGKSRLILKPTTKKLPFVGGLQFCFLETPNFDYDLDGIAGKTKNLCILSITTLK